MRHGAGSTASCRWKPRRRTSAKLLFVESPSAGVHRSPRGVDRLDADGTRVSGQESTNSATRPPLKKPLHWTAPLQWRSEIMSATGVARSDEEDHARDSARSGAEHLLWAMAGGKDAVSGPRIAGHCPQ